MLQGAQMLWGACAVAHTISAEDGATVQESVVNPHAGTVYATRYHQ